MIAFKIVFMIFMSDAICITRFMVCFYLGYFEVEGAKSENIGI